MKQGTVLYIGDFVDEAIMAERGLPYRNAAGSNRIERLAGAMAAANLHPIILSPGTAMRARVKRGPLLHRARVIRNGRTPVIFARAFNPGIFNPLASAFFLIGMIVRLSRKRRLTTAVVYNFNPYLVLVAGFAKFVLGMNVVLNAEDISVPHLSDWSGTGEVRPVQQLVLSVCMNIIALMADAYVVPSTKFIPYLPKKANIAIEPGCMEVPPGAGIVHPSDGPVRILFSGKIEFEHGIDLFVEVLKRLRQCPAPLAVDICGSGPKAQWLRLQLEEFNNPNIRDHGFVSDDTYRQLLIDADICVVLQRPDGRYGDFKSPSKAFEYIGYGKAVISSDVGDIGSLPPGVVRLCSPLEIDVLYDGLLALIEDEHTRTKMAAAAANYARTQLSLESVGRRIGDLFRQCRSM